MTTSWRPRTASEAVSNLEQRYEDLIASGTAQRWVYPWATIGGGAVILYLLVDHRKSRPLSQLRYVVWLFNTLICLYTVAFIRCKNNAPALGVGIVSGWQILWSASFMIFDDCQADYARIHERGAPATPGDTNEAKRNVAVVSSSGSSKNAPAGNGVVHRHGNGHASKHQHLKPDSETKQDVVYEWQRFPESPFKERIWWILDLLTNVRGMNWNWRLPITSEPPIHIRASLAKGPEPPYLPSKPSRTRARDFPSRRAVIRQNVFLIVRNSIILDVVKVFMSYDPYFWGWQYDQTPPPVYLPGSLKYSAFLVRASRLILCLVGIKTCLEMIFALGPLLIIGLLGPNVMGHKAEAWMHPSQFGYVSLLANNGLAGFWGAFWHQTFRKTFETPGEKLVTRLGLAQKSESAKLVKLFLAFALSGFIHACGSATQLGSTNPISGPFLFFILQAVGISIEKLLQAQLSNRGVKDRTPQWFHRIGTLLFCLTWLYFTAPLLVDDFACGGAWLFEPIPFSLLRGPLGLGAEQYGWWRWPGLHIKLYRGKTWWETGILV